MLSPKQWSPTVADVGDFLDKVKIALLVGAAIGVTIIGVSAWREKVKYGHY